MANVTATFSTRAPKVKDNARNYEKPPNEWFNSEVPMTNLNAKLEMTTDYHEQKMIAA